MTARMLIVEDNLPNLALMEYLLKAFGYTVVTATDGAGGIDAAAREPPDVILMDLQMPTLNGFEAVRRLKADPALRKIPVVAVTAFAMVGDRDKILAHGFDGYIAKPIVPETFVDQVQAFMPLDLRSNGSAPHGVAAHPSPPRVTRSNSGGAKILVVDNSRTNLQLMQVILNQFGYDIESAESVAEALAVARQFRPDLILSDIHMPGQSGYDLVRLVRTDARLREIPVMFISATAAGEKERRTALAMGVSGLISRPVEPEMLIAEVEACLKAQAQRPRR